MELAKIGERGGGLRRLRERSSGHVATYVRLPIGRPAFCGLPFGRVKICLCRVLGRRYRMKGGWRGRFPGFHDGAGGH